MEEKLSYLTGIITVVTYRMERGDAEIFSKMHVIISFRNLSCLKGY